MINLYSPPFTCSHVSLGIQVMSHPVESKGLSCAAVAVSSRVQRNEAKTNMHYTCKWTRFKGFIVTTKQTTAFLSPWRHGVQKQDRQTTPDQAWHLQYVNLRCLVLTLDIRSFNGLQLCSVHSKRHPFWLFNGIGDKTIAGVIQVIHRK